MNTIAKYFYNKVFTIEAENDNVQVSLVPKVKMDVWHHQSHPPLHNISVTHLPSQNSSTKSKNENLQAILRNVQALAAFHYDEKLDFWRQKQNLLHRKWNFLP